MLVVYLCVPCVCTHAEVNSLLRLAACGGCLQARLESMWLWYSGAKSEKVAFALAPAITIILILFGGYYINSQSIPRWLFW